MKPHVNLTRKLITTAVIVIILVTISKFALAQDRWSLELRPGVNFAIGKLGDATLETGFGAEGSVAYSFMPHLAFYGGWSWNKFASDQSINGTSLDFEETGYTYGLQFIHPIGGSKINYLARAGGLYNHIEVEAGDKIISDTGHGFGWQIEGGIVFQLDENWRLMPGVRYRSLSSDITIESVSTSVDLNYFSIGLGISLKL